MMNRSKQPLHSIVGITESTRSLQLFVLILSVILRPCTCLKNETSISDLRPGVTKMKPNSQPEARVIGGADAPQGRYPYFVSLVSAGRSHVCGGSLVAPDIVLTAAHCSGYLRYAHVGRHDQTNANDDYEEFDIVLPEIIHPLYNEDEFPYDYMLLKLSGIASNDYVQINSDPSIPVAGIDEGLRIIGLGLTVMSDSNSAAWMLQQVDIDYVENDVCEQSRYQQYSYRGLITDDMLCARDNGEDSCQGDSGGPLIIEGGQSSQDVQVGIVSWGYGCALQSFPGVYARTSHQIDFIHKSICDLSSKPPAEINCGNLDSSLPGENSIPVSITLNLDDFPDETAWSIKSLADQSIVMEIASGTYVGKQTQFKEIVFLEANESYEFEIKDTYGDGMCCSSPGSYEVKLGRSDGTMLASGSGNFGFVKRHQFTMPSELVDDSSRVPAIGPGEIALTIQIQLDSHPPETGWFLDQLGLEVEQIVRVPAGIYTTPQEMIVKTVALVEGELYSFRLFDIMEDGISGGFVKLFLGTTNTDDESAMIFSSDGSFGATLERTFIASFEDQQTNPPQLSDRFLTLELRMDLYPEELALQLRVQLDDDETTATARSERLSQIVFFRPPRYYVGSGDKIILETIPIIEPPSGSKLRYTLIATDSYGDGLCCRWAGKLEAGYTLYDGEISEGTKILESRFEEKGREVTAFDILSKDSPPPDIPGIEPAVIAKRTITVAIGLDQYPDETSFVIQDMNGKTIANYPAGTYAEGKGVTVTEDIELSVGVYRFTISDVFGDGLNYDSSFYQIRYAGDDANGRPPLVDANGVFGSDETHIFIVEDPKAAYPLSIEFTTDAKPSEFGFSIFRLDVLEANAIVASMPPGSFQNANEQQMVELTVESGGLYKIQFVDEGKNGIGGQIYVRHGGLQLATLDAGNFQDFPIKFLAGNLAETSVNGQTMDLRVKLDRFPHEFEWVLLGHDVLPQVSTQRSTSQDHTVVDYGPMRPFTAEYTGVTAIQTIRLPPFYGSKRFTIIISDTAGDGVCCEFGAGGPVELFNGPIGIASLILTDPFANTARITKTFNLVGNDEAAAPNSNKSSSARIRGTAVLFLSFCVVFFAHS